jgi:hypothetical protein
MSRVRSADKLQLFLDGSGCDNVSSMSCKMEWLRLRKSKQRGLGGFRRERLLQEGERGKGEKGEKKKPPPE